MDRVRMYVTLFTAAVQPTGLGIKTLVDTREVMLWEAVKMCSAPACTGQCAFALEAFAAVLGRPDVQSVRLEVVKGGDDVIH